MCCVRPSFSAFLYLFIHTTPQRIDKLAKVLKDMELSEEQRINVAAFLDEKAAVLKCGELKEGQLARLDELGYGNGGVVLKVEHRPTGIIMARKVRWECQWL